MVEINKENVTGSISSPPIIHKKFPKMGDKLTCLVQVLSNLKFEGRNFFQIVPINIQERNGNIKEIKEIVVEGIPVNKFAKGEEVQIDIELREFEREVAGII
jgi:hypothetical protein